MPNNRQNEYGFELLTYSKIQDNKVNIKQQTYNPEIEVKIDTKSELNKDLLF